MTHTSTDQAAPGLITTARRSLQRYTAASRESLPAAVARFVKNTFLQLPHVRPGRWRVLSQGAEIAALPMYQHLRPLLLAEPSMVDVFPTLAPLLVPDVVIARVPEPDETLDRADLTVVDAETARCSPLRALNNDTLLLHASISCKWTLRSDRGQNARTEALNLTRNRKGWVPHAMLVTAEPLPTRIQSVTGGMGDLDCVYHIALPELIAACTEAGDLEVLGDMVKGRRLRDISDLPLDLAV